MEGSEFSEEAFFGAIGDSGARALLIGRRALVALGIPVMTADYDYWVHPEDAASFNEALEPLGLHPNASPEDARARGRYALENDEHVDVLLARSLSTADGDALVFDEIWENRRTLEMTDGIEVAIPQLDDLIRTKRLGERAKDAEDIRLLEILRGEEGEET